MSTNGTITKTVFTEKVDTSIKIKHAHIAELRTAIERLQGYSVNVDNCGNCVYCQTCQSLTCQITTCQSSSCQSTSCQRCQSTSCQYMQCNCDCSDDRQVIKMAYTDPNLNNNTSIRKAHISELSSALENMATKAKKTQLIDTSTITYTKVTAANIINLRKAINDLEASFSSNCCQANCCQTCQAVGCQSSTCQSCQVCETCQKCQTYSCQYCQSECRNCNCNCNCNCDCGDDS